MNLPIEKLPAQQLADFTNTALIGAVQVMGMPSFYCTGSALALLMGKPTSFFITDRPLSTV